MHCIYFSQFVFDEFIAKGEENVHKWQNSLLTGWLREVYGKYDKFYLRGRACIESVKGSFVSGGVLSLSFSFVCRFSCHLLVLCFSFF
jgi:hypothetical protein